MGAYDHIRPRIQIFPPRVRLCLFQLKAVLRSPVYKGDAEIRIFTALPGKAYTFRADPDRVTVLEQLGVDTVTLANNHVYDYGEEALL